MINLNDLLKKNGYLVFNNNVEIDTEKNSIFFGPNGIGKTTIYKAIKSNYENFMYLDYEEMRTLFLKNYFFGS